MIRSLSRKGHEITLATLWSNETERADLDNLGAYCRQIITMKMPTWRSLLNCTIAIASNQPLQSVYSWNPKLVEGLNGNSPFDVIHVEHLRGVRLGLHLKKHTKLPVVWDSVDCISYLFRQASQQSKNAASRLITRLELGRTEIFEGWLPSQFNHVLVTSNKDKDALINLQKEQATPEKFTVLPNGVDLDYFQPNKKQNRAGNTLVISGKMSYHANVAMALHTANNIMPRVWVKQPDVQLQIVGKDPSREVLALGQQDGITVTGTVPDMRPYLQSATIALTPLIYGAGIQNKVLEAMACGTPVISSPQATAGLQNAIDGKHLLVAANEQLFADHILSLLSDSTLRSSLGVAGRDYVESQYDWSHIATQMEEIYYGVQFQSH
jgi:glycosyltransferase involved in cell wall biosynthesis